jgi:hypothetical protein
MKEKKMKKDEKKKRLVGDLDGDGQNQDGEDQNQYGHLDLDDFDPHHLDFDHRHLDLQYARLLQSWRETNKWNIDKSRKEKRLDHARS